MPHTMTMFSSFSFWLYVTDSSLCLHVPLEMMVESLKIIPAYFFKAPRRALRSDLKSVIAASQSLVQQYSKPSLAI